MFCYLSAIKIDIEFVSCRIRVFFFAVTEKRISYVDKSELVGRRTVAQLPRGISIFAYSSADHRHVSTLRKRVCEAWCEILDQRQSRVCRHLNLHLISVSPLGTCLLQSSVAP